MKKLIVTIVLVISSLSFAQEKSKLSPEQQTELQIKKMTLDLDLDANQQKELRTILLENAKKREAKKMALKEKMSKGQKPTTDEQFEMKSKMLDDKIEHKAQLKKILKPEQFQKWEQNQENRTKNLNQKRKNSKEKRKATQKIEE
jgi:protein CpxP